MPFAPQTINIRYGNPADVVALAGQAGVAENRMSNARLQYQGFMQRLGLDQSFLENEANRRQDDAHFQANLAQKQEEARSQDEAKVHATELQDAYHQAILALREKTSTGQQKIGQERVDAINARLEAQKNGSIGSGRGRASAALDLVPAEGPIDRPSEGTASMTENSTGSTVSRVGGGPITGDYGNTMEGGFAGPSSSSKAGMVPRIVRRQLDAIEAERSTISPEDYSALKTAATGGMMKDDQLIDDLRAAKLKAPKASPLTYEAKQDAKVAETIHQTEALASAPDSQKIAWAKQNAGSSGVFMDDKEALDYFVTANANAKTILAYQRPITNSGGTTPTGGNVVKVQTPADAARLPSGTVYMAPDGVLRRIP